MKAQKSSQAADASGNRSTPVDRQSGEPSVQPKTPASKKTKNSRIRKDEIRPVKFGSVLIPIWQTTNRGKPIFKARYKLNGQPKEPSSRSEESLRREVEADAIAISNGQTVAMDLTQEQRMEYVQSNTLLANTEISVSDACREFAKAYESLNRPDEKAEKKEESSKVPPISVFDACREFAEAYRVLNGRSIVAAAIAFAKRFPFGIPTITLREARAKVIDAKEKLNRADATIKGLRNNPKPFESLFETPVLSLTKAAIEGCRDQMPGCPRSKNNAVETLVTILNWCQGNGFFPRNEELPTARIEPIVVRRDKPTIYKPDEASKILENLDWTLLPDAILQGWLGLRPKEAKRSKFSDFNFPEEKLFIPKINSKSAPDRTVLFTPTASTLLAPYYKCRGPVSIYSQSESSLSRAASRGGVKYLQDGFRHSYASYRLQILTAIGISDPWGALALEMGTSLQRLKTNYINDEATLDQAIIWFSITLKRVYPPSIYNERRVKGQRITAALRLEREKYTRMFGMQETAKIERAVQEIKAKIIPDLEDAKAPDFDSIRFDTTEELLEMEPLKMAREIRDRNQELYARMRQRVTRNRHLE